MSCVFLGVSSPGVDAARNHLPRKASRRHQMPEPPQLTPLDEQRLYLSSSRVTELLTLSLRERQPPCGEEAHFGPPVSGILSFLVMTLFRSFTTTDRYIDRTTAEAAPIRLSISRSILPSLVNKTPKILKLVHLWQDLSTNLRGQATFFRLSTMALDLEALILIPAALHSAAKPSQCMLEEVLV